MKKRIVNYWLISYPLLIGVTGFIFLKDYVAPDIWPVVAFLLIMF